MLNFIFTIKKIGNATRIGSYHFRKNTNHTVSFISRVDFREIKLHAKLRCHKIDIL